MISENHNVRVQLPDPITEDVWVQRSHVTGSGMPRVASTGSLADCLKAQANPIHPALSTTHLSVARMLESRPVVGKKGEKFDHPAITKVPDFTVTKKPFLKQKSMVDMRHAWTEKGRILKAFPPLQVKTKAKETDVQLVDEEVTSEPAEAPVKPALAPASPLAPTSPLKPASPLAPNAAPVSNEVEGATKLKRKSLTKGDSDAKPSRFFSSTNPGLLTITRWGPQDDKEFTSIGDLSVVEASAEVNERYMRPIVRTAAPSMRYEVGATNARLGDEGSRKETLKWSNHCRRQ